MVLLQMQPIYQCLHVSMRELRASQMLLLQKTLEVSTKEETRYHNTGTASGIRQTRRTSVVNSNTGYGIQHLEFGIFTKDDISG